MHSQYLTYKRFLRKAHAVLALIALAVFAPPSANVVAQQELMLLNDMVLDNEALLMPISAPYGRAINGVSFQTEVLTTAGDYQYATWYHDGNNEDVYIARRDLTGTTWEVLDTGENMTRGDGPSWDAHNVISMNASSDGRLHLSWDMHGHDLRYMNTSTGVTTTPGGTWNSSIFNPEQDSLNSGGATLGGVTYPRLVNAPNGNMILTYRTGGSGNGDMQIATYDATTGLWNTPHEFINGTDSIFYDDDFGGGSNNRNAYLNGIDFDATGRLHTTWTWRESATGSSNHDIAYAYSDDGGNTWHNNAGTVIGTVGNPIDYNSPGIAVVPLDRGNTLMNQQTRAVDQDGRVHTVMWHKEDLAAPLTGFTTQPAVYYHYYRDPTSGNWSRTELPTSRAVGSRPDIAYDNNGNLYVAYLSGGPGDGVGVLDYYTDGDLVIASASKASAYTDWSIVYNDTRDFSGEPFLDQQRLLAGGVVSVFVQENDDVDTGRTGTPLHVLEFNQLSKKLRWAGNNLGVWDTGIGSDWDSDGDSAGDDAFAAGNRVVFDNSASTFSVTIANPVSPEGVDFRNTSTNAYVLSGASITGGGHLTVSGGGTVTLAGGAHTYSGQTTIESGTLALTGTATADATPTIHVHGDGTLDVAGLDQPFTLASGQQLDTSNGASVVGNVEAAANSTITGQGRFAGSLLLQAGATLQVGGVGLQSVAGVPSVETVIDDFNVNDGAAGFNFAKVLDFGDGATNTVFFETGGTLNVFLNGDTGLTEQTLLLHPTSLLPEREVRLNVENAVVAGGRDFGLAIGESHDDLGDGVVGDNRGDDDFVFLSLRNDDFDLGSRGFLAGGEIALAQYNNVSLDTLFIKRLANDDIELGVYEEGTRVVLRTLTPATLDIFDNVGFYTDTRIDGGAWFGGDDLAIYGNGVDAFFGETLTVEGDLTLESGSNLVMDIGASGSGDLLSVGNHFTAAGTLQVLLDDQAPMPEIGDQFDLLDFSTASGDFEAFLLPTLASGLAWDVTHLLETGEIAVVVNVDLDNDGDVDGRDYLLIQSTDGTLIIAWQDLYGSQLVVPESALATVVPEPTSLVLLGIGASLMLFGKHSTYQTPQLTANSSDRSGPSAGVWARFCLALWSSVCVGGVVSANDVNGANQQWTPTDLSCEFLTHPEKTRIADPRPEFAWVCSRADDAYQQSAYQLRVHEFDSSADTEGEVVWDTGKIESRQSINVEYDGPELTADARYVWTVRSWDQDDQVSDWAPLQRFRMARQLDSAITSRYRVEKIPQPAIEVKKLSERLYLADFGTDAFGYLKLKLPAQSERRVLKVRFGEKLQDGRIDQQPGGTIRYYEKSVQIMPDTEEVVVRPPRDHRNTHGQAIRLPRYVGVVAPFRYVEVEGDAGGLTEKNFDQIRIEYPFDEQASHFESSDATLNAIWDLCKYSIRATTFCGVYVDGDRERIPYEADAYLNQLAHYGVDREFALPRYSHEYLLANPTWPTEWKQHSVLMAWADYLYTGNRESLEQHFELLEREKILTAAELPSGLVDTSASEYRDIVDWPEVERDGYEMLPVNTVVNAFHYATLQCMAKIAEILDKPAKHDEYSAKAAAFHVEFNKAFWHAETQAYVDGAGSQHCSIHASLFPLAFGLVPDERVPAVVKHIKSRGMGCSVYAAQYLLEGLYHNGEAKYALSLLTSHDQRSWYNMIRSGATITLEAWDIQFKPNLDWNHAWGAVPASIIPTYVVGVQPAKPGYEEVLVQPRPADLASFDARVPTIRGPVEVRYERSPDDVRLDVELPGNTIGTIAIPLGEGKSPQRLTHNGKVVPLEIRDGFAWLENAGPGLHSLRAELTTDSATPVSLPNSAAR